MWVHVLVLRIDINITYNCNINVDVMYMTLYPYYLGERFAPGVYVRIPRHACGGAAAYNVACIGFNDVYVIVPISPRTYMT